MSALLHPENLKRIPFYGTLIQKQLHSRIQTIRAETKGRKDPDVSVIIRTKNDIDNLPRLLADIRAQEYTGKIEIILVDTSSTNGTVEHALSQDIKVISLTQDSFTYPRALNMGFEAASHKYVVSLVGHSSLSSTMMLRCLTYWHKETNFGGLYSFPLPDRNASFTERIASAIWLPHRMFSAETVTSARPGMLGANSSIVSRDAWKQLGGYDERYAGGGEDTALGRSMLEAGMTVVYKPAFSVFHSHGLGFIDGLKQINHWREVAGTRPQPFDTTRVMSRRPDLRRKERM